MSAHRPPEVALAALAERICDTAGTDLAAVLTDLRAGTATPATPDAIRAGWSAPDTVIPERTVEAFQ